MSWRELCPLCTAVIRWQRAITSGAQDCLDLLAEDSPAQRQSWSGVSIRAAHA